MEDNFGYIWALLDKLRLIFNWVILIFIYREVLPKIRNEIP